MNTTTQIGTAGSQENRSGPGAMLAQARSDLRLSQEDVAARLHLTTRQIQGLEGDDYSGMPGATYVRGYLRSYAMLLNLEPEIVLKAHAHFTAKPVVPDFSTIAPQKQITSHHHQIRFVTYVVAIIVIGLAIAWWQSRQSKLPNPLPAVTMEEPASAVPAPEVANNTSSEPVATGAMVVTPTTATVTPAVPAATAPVAKPPEMTASPTVVVPPVTAISPNAPRVRLVLHADQDAWVDIRDARQAKLLYETVTAGRSVPLEGVAPISIFLGNAAATRIEFNGEAVDVERHRRGVFARFTLGDSATVPARQP